MRHGQAWTWSALLGFVALQVLLLIVAACGRVDWEVPSLPREDIVDPEPEPEPEPVPEIPWTDPFEAYPYDFDYFSETVQPMLQSDGCATCHVITYTFSPRLHEDPAPDSPEMWHNFEETIGQVDLDLDAEDAHLVHWPLISESHVTTTWHESRQGPERYAPVVDWIRDAQAVRECYELRYEDVVEYAAAAVWDEPCDPPPNWSCWPHEECPEDEEPPEEENGEEENGDEEEENGGGGE